MNPFNIETLQTFDIVYRAYHFYMRAKNSLDIAERMLEIQNSTDDKPTWISIKVYIQHELNEARRQLERAINMLDLRLK